MSQLNAEKLKLEGGGLMLPTTTLAEFFAQPHEAKRAWIERTVRRMRDRAASVDAQIIRLERLLQGVKRRQLAAYVPGEYPRETDNA